MSCLSQNASKRIGPTIANYLSVPLRSLAVVLREPIAWVSGNVVQWSWGKFGRADNLVSTSNSKGHGELECDGV